MSSGNPFETKAPGQTETIAPPTNGDNPFGGTNGTMANPFAAPVAGGEVGPAVRDLVGRVVGLRVTEKGEKPAYEAKNGEMQTVYVCHVVVFTGGMITTMPTGEDVPLNAQPVELGMPVKAFWNRFIYGKGIQNKFGGNAAILGRIKRLPKGQQARAALTTWQSVEEWLATNPNEQLVKQAQLFWTIEDDDLTDADRKLSHEWVTSGSVEAKRFLNG